MTVTVNTPTREDRRTTLRRLARDWDGWDAAIRELLLAGTVHESMRDEHPARGGCTCGICLACTWDSYRGDMDLLDGFGTWWDWRVVNDKAPSEKAAWDEITERVGGLEDLLLDGAGARGRKAAPAAPEAGQAA